jgi:hypothetical protein
MGHHYLPQRYLRNFEDPSQPGCIWLHDKRSSLLKSVPIEEVAQSSGYYDQEDERLLAEEVEKPANAVMKKLESSTTISESERLQLAFYIAVMLKRVPEGRKRATALIPDVVRQVMADAKEGLTKLAEETSHDPLLLAKRLAELDELEQKYQKQHPAVLIEQIRKPWPTPQMVALIAMMTWRILISFSPRKLSDN